MSKIDVNRLKVALPCTVSWDSMKGDERARHCGVCSLNVYNIAAMTSAEAEQLVTKREGRLCIRLYRRADGTVITNDCPVGLRKVRQRMARVASAAFASILGLVTIGYGQKADRSTPDLSGARVIRTDAPQAAGSVRGIFVDPNGAVVPGVEVTVVSERGKRKVKTDADGRFNIPSGVYGNFRVEAESPGFRKFSRSFDALGANESLELTLTMDVGFMMGVFVDEADSTVDVRSSTVQTTISERKLRSLPFE
jgi:Carboxypeptidase regulatory-like domain